MKVQSVAVVAWLLSALCARADETKLTAAQQLVHDIYAEIIAIDTTHSTGSTTRAADAIAKRLVAAGFPGAEIHRLGPTPTKGNLVVRLHGAADKRPLLLLAHLDVVEGRTPRGAAVLRRRRVSAPVDPGVGERSCPVTEIRQAEAGIAKPDRAGVYSRIVKHPYRVRPGKPVRLAAIDADFTGKHPDEGAARVKLARDLERLTEFQDKLYAEHRRAVLIVLQGMDTGGKDGTIKHVMSGVNPSGLEVAPFKVPTQEEADHDFLWRAHRYAPRRGHITIFNRSHYEDVLVPFVHRTVPRHVVRQRYDQINAFERILIENDTLVLKFFLHISEDEQRKRLRERLKDPTKQWKFSEADVKERRLWPRYTKAYERLLTHCSTPHAPWYVVPANHKWYRNLVVAEVLADAGEALGCEYPKPALSGKQLKRVRL